MEIFGIFLATMLQSEKLRAAGAWSSPRATGRGRVLLWSWESLGLDLGGCNCPMLQVLCMFAHEKFYFTSVKFLLRDLQLKVIFCDRDFTFFEMNYSISGNLMTYWKAVPNLSAYCPGTAQFISKLCWENTYKTSVFIKHCLGCKSAMLLCQILNIFNTSGQG